MVLAVAKALDVAGGGRTIGRVTTTPCDERPLPPPPRGGVLRRGLGRTFGGFPRQFWFQWTGVLVNRLGTFVQPFLILYLTSARGLSIQQAGLVITVWGGGALVAPVVGGWLADRVGRRETLAGGMIAAGVSLAALGAVTSLPAIIVAAFVVGLTGDIYRPAASAHISDIVAPADRQRAYGLLFWAINLGFAVAAVAGGYLAQAGYGLLFALDALTCVLFGLLMWAGASRDHPRAPTTGGPRAGYRTALRDRALLAILALTVLSATVYAQAYVTLPLAMRDAGLPASSYGAVVAVNGLAIVLVQPFAGVWLARFDPGWVLAVSSLVLGAGFAATGLASDGWAFAGTVLLWTLGEIGFAGTVPALVADLAPVEARGRYQGLFGLAFGASFVAGPLLGTAVYAGPGPAVLWTGCLLAGVVVGLGHLAVCRAARRRLAPGAEHPLADSASGPSR